MQPKTVRRIHLIYGVVLSVLIVAVGICFALSCVDIYRSGESPFSRASVWEHFRRIAIPVWITIAGVVGGIVLSLVLPLETGRVKPIRDERVGLAKIAARVDMAALSPEMQAGIRRAHTVRRVWLIAAVAVSVLAAIPALWWCLTPSHFGDNLHATDDVRRAAFVVVPCAAVALAAWVAAVLVRGASYHKEAVMLKLASADPACRKKASAPVSPEKRLVDSPLFLWSVRGILLAVAVLFIVLGIRNGGMADVLGKAVRICTECIGLG